LSQVPFGRLYEGILLVKLLLFALMLASGAGLARRAHRVWSEDVAAGDGVLRLGLRRLGVYGVVFVASAPLIVAPRLRSGTCIFSVTSPSHREAEAERLVGLQWMTHSRTLL